MNRRGSGVVRGRQLTKCFAGAVSAEKRAVSAEKWGVQYTLSIDQYYHHHRHRTNLKPSSDTATHLDWGR